MANLIAQLQNILEEVDEDDEPIDINRKYRNFLNWYNSLNPATINDVLKRRIYIISNDYFFPAFPPLDYEQEEFKYIVTNETPPLNYDTAMNYYNAALSELNARMNITILLQGPEMTSIGNRLQMHPERLLNPQYYFKPHRVYRMLQENPVEVVSNQRSIIKQQVLRFDRNAVRQIQNLIDENEYPIGFALFISTHYDPDLNREVAYGGFTLFRTIDYPHLMVDSLYIKIVRQYQYISTQQMPHPVLFEYVPIAGNRPTALYKYQIMHKVDQNTWKSIDCPYYHRQIVGHRQPRGNAPAAPIYGEMSRFVLRKSIDPWDMYLQTLLDNNPSHNRGIYMPQGEIDLRTFYQMMKKAVDRTYWLSQPELNIRNINNPSEHLFDNEERFGRNRLAYTVRIHFFTLEDRDANIKRTETWRDLKWNNFADEQNGEDEFLNWVENILFNIWEYESADGTVYYKEPIAGLEIDLSQLHIKYWNREADADVALQFQAYNCKKKDYIIYESIPQLSNYSKCIPYSILRCKTITAIQRKKHAENLKNCVNVDELVRYIREKDLPISVMYNIPKFNFYDKFFRYKGGSYASGFKGNYHVNLYPKQRGSNLVEFIRLHDKDIEHKFLYQCRGFARFDIIVYDHIHKHCEVIADPANIKLKNDVWVHDDVDVIRIIKKTPEQEQEIRDYYDKMIEDKVLDNNGKPMKNMPLSAFETYIHVRTHRKRIQPILAKKKEDVKFVFFDMECVSDEDNEYFSQPYAISWIILGFDELKEMHDIEVLYKTNKVAAERKEKIFKKKCNHITSLSCVTHFLTELQCYMKETVLRESSVDYKYRLVGFNNSNYDNFMLLKELQYIYSESEDQINYVEFHGSSRIGEIIFFKRYCSVLDLRRHLTTGSLDSNSKNFGVVLFGKKPDLISHSLVQYIFNCCKRQVVLDYIEKYNLPDELIGDITNHPEYTVALQRKFYEALYDEVEREKLMEYNNYDILSLALLFYRYYEDTQTMNCLKELQVANIPIKPVYYHVSLPSFLFSISSKLSKKNLIHLEDVYLYQYNFIKKGSIAGRIDYFMKMNSRYWGEVVSLDVCSMYPYIMFCAADVWFPCGKSTYLHNVTQEKKMKLWIF